MHLDDPRRAEVHSRGRLSAAERSVRSVKRKESPSRRPVPRLSRRRRAAQRAGLRRARPFRRTARRHFVGHRPLLAAGRPVRHRSYGKLHGGARRAKASFSGWASIDGCLMLLSAISLVLPTGRVLGFDAFGARRGSRRIVVVPSRSGTSARRAARCAIGGAGRRQGLDVQVGPVEVALGEMAERLKAAVC